MGRYRKLGTMFDRDFRNDYNLNVDDMEKDIDKFLADAAAAKTTAGSAETKATSAVTTAGEAKTKAETVQTQLNNIVLENGNSNPEIVQARGSAPVLNERLNGLDAQLADIVMNVKEFGAKVDGVTDDSAALQNALDTISNQGGGQLFIPPGNLMITKTINLRSNVLIVGVNNTRSKISILSGITPFLMFDTTQGTGNRIWFGFQKIQINAALSSQFLAINNAYYYFFDEVQVFGNTSIDGIVINAIGIFGYYGVINKSKFNNFRTGVKGNASANSNRFINTWFYGCKVGVELIDANGNSFTECSFRDYTEAGIWFNDSGSGTTTRNIIQNSYFEPVKQTASVLCGVRLSGNAQSNEIFGGKYSNLRGEGKPEVLYDNDYVRNNNLRLEYNGHSRQEVMVMPNFLKVVQIDEDTKPTAADIYSGSLSHTRKTGARDKIRAVLRESTGTPYWAELASILNGQMNMDNANITNLGLLIQNPGSYMRFGRTAPTTPAVGDAYFDNSTGVKKIKLYDGTAWRTLAYEV